MVTKEGDEAEGPEAGDEGVGAVGGEAIAWVGVGEAITGEAVFTVEADDDDDDDEEDEDDDDDEVEVEEEEEKVGEGMKGEVVGGGGAGVNNVGSPDGDGEDYGDGAGEDGVTMEAGSEGEWKKEECLEGSWGVMGSGSTRWWSMVMRRWRMVMNSHEVKSVEVRGSGWISGFWRVTVTEKSGVEK